MHLKDNTISKFLWKWSRCKRITEGKYGSWGKSLEELIIFLGENIMK